MGSTERIISDANYEPIDSKKKFNLFRSTRTCPEACTTPLCRPLRIFQFLTTLLLFAMVVYLTVRSAGKSSTTATSETARLADAAVASTIKPSDSGASVTEPKPPKIEEKASATQKLAKLRASKPGQYLTHLASILLITLTSSYLFFLAIEIISQFGYRGLPDSPMFLFSFLGVLLFGIAGALMVHYRNSQDTLPELMLSQVLCFVISALFLIEITMLLSWWRLKCLSWKKCYPYTPECQREVDTLFERVCPYDIKTEVGKCDITTSISHVEIPLETDLDSAVEEHRLRKIGIGHRRQYVDRPTSVPTFSSVQIAEIQTDISRHCVTECQTQRTEMRESIIQTSSRCELCNRQMESTHPSQNISASPLTTPQSLISPQSTTAPVSQCQLPQQGHCTMCPAFFHMMRGGMASPCCQSCNCGETTKEQPRQPMPYLLNETLQRQQTEIELPQIQQESQKQLPRTSTITSRLTATGTETSTPTPSEKSQVELRGSSTSKRASKISSHHKVVNEGNRYRPSKKVPRVYETRPCPTHGSGLAAKMAGLPESVTRVTLSSISLRRNKRTQTPSKTSASQAMTDTEKDESREDVDVKGLEDTSEDYDYGKDETVEKHQSVTIARGSDGSTSDNKSGIISDVHKKSISDVELRKRLSEDPRISYVSATKSVLDSQSREKASDPSILVEMNEKLEGQRSSTSKPKLSGKVLYRANRSDPRISEQAGRELSWFRDKSSIKERSESDWDVEKSSEKFTSEGTDDEGQSVVKDEAFTPLDSELSAIEEENSDSGTSTVIKKESGTFSNIGRQESRISSTPVLRLRLEESGKDFETSTQRIGDSEETVRRTSSKNLSASKGLLSKTQPTTPSRSRTRSYDSSDGSIGTHTSGRGSQIIQSPTKKASAVSQERSGKIERDRSDSYLDFPCDDVQIGENRTPTRLSELEDKKDAFSDREDEEIEPQELSTAESEAFAPSSPVLSSRSSMSERINSSPALRLKSERIGDDFEGSQRQIDESDDVILRSSSKSRSTLKGLLSKAASAISSRSMTRRSETSDASIGKQRSDKSSRVIRSPTSKTSALSQERSVNIERSLSDFPTKDRTSSEQRTSARWSAFVERSEDESSQKTDEDLAETIIQEGSGAESEEFESSPRVSGTRQSMQEKIGNRSPSRSQLENARQDSKASTLRVSEHDRDILRSNTRSTSKPQLSKADSEISSGSKRKKDGMSEVSMDRQKRGSGSEIIRSPMSKVSIGSQGLGSGKIEKDIVESYSDLAGRQRKFSERATSSRLSQFRPKSEEGSSDRVDDDDSETIIEKWSGAESELSAPSPRLSSTKPSVPEDIGSKVSRFRVAESGDVIRSTVAKSRSTSKGQLSKTVSTISSGSKTGKDEMSEVPVGKRRSGQGSQIIRSPTSKASIVSRDKSEKIGKDSLISHSDLSSGQRKFSTREVSSRFSQFAEKSEDESTEMDEEAEGEEIENSSVVESEIFASSPRVSRTKPSTDQNIGTRATSRIQSEKDVEHANDSERRVSADDVMQRTRSKSISSGSKTRKDEISEVSVGKRSKKGTDIVRSSQKIDPAIPKSYSDLPGGQRKFKDRRTSERLSEFGERGEEQPEKDEQVQSKVKIDSLVASESRLSRTNRNIDQKFEQTKDCIEENIDEPRGATKEISLDRNLKTPKEESRTSRTESSGEFIYVPAPWSSDGSVLQRKSRIESVDQQRQTLVVNPNRKLHGPSRDGPSATQCVTNDGCPTFEMRAGGVSSICTDETACVDACSCRIKSILLRQCSVHPHREPVRYIPVEPYSTRQYSRRQLHFPRILSWALRRKETLPDRCSTRSREISRSSNQPKRFIMNNFCHVS